MDKWVENRKTKQAMITAAVWLFLFASFACCCVISMMSISKRGMPDCYDQDKDSNHYALELYAGPTESLMVRLSLELVYKLFIVCFLAHCARMYERGKKKLETSDRQNFMFNPRIKVIIILIALSALDIACALTY